MWTAIGLGLSALMAGLFAWLKNKDNLVANTQSQALQQAIYMVEASHIQEAEAMQAGATGAVTGASLTDNQGGLDFDNFNNRDN